MPCYCKVLPIYSYDEKVEISSLQSSVSLYPFRNHFNTMIGAKETFCIITTIFSIL